MSIKIYGPVQSRTSRTLWMAEEIKAVKAADFSHIGELPSSDAEIETFKQLNPMMQVPVIDADGFALSESMAINLYLAKKFDVLAPRSIEEEAILLQWSFWVMSQVEAAALTALKHKLGLMGFEKDDAKADEALSTLERPLNVLEGKLKGQPYLNGDEFGLVDLNVSSVIMWVQATGSGLANYPTIVAWLNSCLQREAAVAARKG